MDSGQIIAAIRDVAATKSLAPEEMQDLIRDGILAGLARIYGPNVEGSGSHLVDAAGGIRLKVFRSLILSANVQVPINRDEGLRPDFIWSLGFDYTFGGD